MKNGGWILSLILGLIIIFNWKKIFGTSSLAVPPDQAGSNPNAQERSASEDENTVERVYRSKNGTTVTVKGDKNDSAFMSECEKLKGNEPHTFSAYPGLTFYPLFYKFYYVPYAYTNHPYPYYYYPSYPHYTGDFLGGYRRYIYVF